MKCLEINMEVKMSHQERRKRLIQKIVVSMKEVKDKGLKLDKEKLIAMMGVQEGASRRTSQEYIKCAESVIENDLDT